MTEIHADDYALTPGTSEDLLELIKEGILDGISVVPNMECFEECMEKLIREIPALPFLPVINVHLNMVEGFSLSDNDGSFIGYTWKSLFLASFNPVKRGTVKKRLKNEINEQLSRGWEKISLCIKKAEESGIPCAQRKLRIDSHQHTHVIPVMWNALTEVLTEKGFETEYIRCPAEPFRPFACAHSLWKSYSPVNLLKNRILKVLSVPAERLAVKEGRNPMYLWGLMMSGRMDEKRVKLLFHSVMAYAGIKGKNLEILFHPGRMRENELSEAIPFSSCETFYLSENRDLEKAGAGACRKLLDRNNCIS